MPDVTANGVDGPLTISQGTNLIVDIEIDPGRQVELEADWWVAASSPFGRYWYTLSEGWVKSDSPKRAYGGPLIYLSPYNVLNNSNLPVGEYTFYFGVDTIMNGLLDFDKLSSDEVDVTIE